MGPPDRADGRASSRTRWWLGVLVGLLLIGAGVSAAVLLVGGGAASFASGVPVRLHEPVTDAPELDWTYQLPGAVTGATSGPGGVQGVFVSTEKTVARLDLDGAEQWSVEPSSRCTVILSHPDVEDVILCRTDVGVLGLAADSGEEKWVFAQGRVARYVDAGAIFVGEAQIGLLDLSTGKAVWSIDATDAIGYATDAVYTSQSGTLAKLDVDTGKQEWSIDYEPPPLIEGEQGSASLDVVATEKVVFLYGASGATAYDPVDGAQLWAVDAGLAGTVAGAFDEERVFVLAGADKGASSGAWVYDAEGKVGALETDPGATYVVLERFRVDGDDYALDYVSGRVYDADLKTVGTYDGAITLVDAGLYLTEKPSVEDGAGDPGTEQKATVAYYELGADDPEWSVAVTFVDELNVAAADGLVIVVADDEVRGYR